MVNLKKITREIKTQAKTFGADLVGITTMDRFEGAPMQMDPRYIMPEAKSCVVIGIRVLRGSLRGIEEGTFFSNYSSMGYGAITYNYLPLMVINLCRHIEDMGYEAFPMGHQSDWRAIDNKGGLRPYWSKPVEPGKPAPDIMVHLRLAAFMAGLGEIGWSKMLITPEFGPAVRFGIILTELELIADPIYEGPELCNKCMSCVNDCPGGAISKKNSVKVTVGGHELEWGEVDTDACDMAFRGASEVNDPEIKVHYLKGFDNIMPNHISPFYYRPNKLYNSGQAICGSRGCTRACLASLEKRKVLTLKFKKPFRRKKPWKINWSEYRDLHLLPAGSQSGTSTKLDTD